MQGPLSTQGPGSGGLSESSKATFGWASHWDALHWHLGAGSLTPLSLPGGREEPRQTPSECPPPRLPLTPIPLRVSAGTSVQVAHPHQRSSWHTAASQGVGEQHRALPAPARSSWEEAGFAHCLFLTGCGWAGGTQDTSSTPVAWRHQGPAAP